MVKDSELEEDFEDFLAAFPESKLAPVARIKLKRIKRLRKRTEEGSKVPNRNHWKTRKNAAI